MQSAGDAAAPRAMPRVLAIVGPTAAGKSALALELARAHGLPVFACDSVQVYRGLDIGSAKPTAAERAAVPHELIDVVDPDASFSAGDYASLAHARIDRIKLNHATRSPTVILCGGTGLYLRAFAWTQSVRPGEDLSREDPQRRAFEAKWEAAEAAAPGAVARELARLDAKTAADIHPKNVVRALRALWLCELHGRPVSEVRAEDPPRLRVDLRCVYIEPEREQLRARIFARCDEMMAQGWMGEVEKLLAAGYHPGLKSMRSLGYKQLCAHAQGEIGLDQAVEQIKAQTWAYARRQRTWFRHQLPAPLTLRTAGPLDAEARHEIEAFLRPREARS